MNVLSSSSCKNFTRAADVEIPSIFNNRFKFGVEDLDAVFGGNGIIPGFTFMLAGAAGSMKTTFLMQCLELLENNGKNTAYISGEEPTPQMALAAKRLGVSSVKLANMTDIDEICEAIIENKFDIVILDSFPCLTSKKKLNKRQLEEYCVTKIIKTAKDHNIAIGVIMHQTKSGNYKGTSLYPHSCDCTMLLRKNPEDEMIRDIEVTKNRYGMSTSFSFPISASGFTFESVEVESPVEAPKKGKKVSKRDVVLEVLNTPKTIAEIVTECGVNGAYLQNLLREVVNEGLVSKSGKGASATFVKI